VGNGHICWYDLDLPEVIAFRQSISAGSGRSAYIAKSIFDDSWMDDIAFNKENGIIFVAAGLFYYFYEAEVKELVRKLAARFSSGELLFDACSKSGIAISNKMVLKSGNIGAPMRFYVGNAQLLKAWSEQIREVRALPYFGGVNRDIRKCYKTWSIKTKLRMFLGDFLKMTKLIHIYFD
jgi:O-methyltransferase involved in polyketide biosynthesis